MLELGKKVSLDDLILVSRKAEKLSFSDDYKARVNKARALVYKWHKEKRIMYGVNTGFGVLCSKIISQEDSKQLQENIILSHSTSVGKPLEIDEVRAMMFVMLCHLGQGHSGVSLDLLERIKELLNENITPFVPQDGSVAYLSTEAHIGLVLIGKGKVFYKGVLQNTQKLYKEKNIKPFVLGIKEGLALISGNTSPTALGALSLHDMLVCAKGADIICAMSLEVNRANLRALDERVMSVKPHTEQAQTAKNINKILSSSEILKKSKPNLQDSLALRAIPQVNGAVKKTLNDALLSIELELNSTCDNPVIYPQDDDGECLSACLCDGSYVGLELDSSCIGACMLAKTSERRTYRILDEKSSGFPYFLVKNAGINSGLMISQYTQAGLLNDMKLLSAPCVSDNISTCAGQEDYVSMAYNSAKKSRKVANNLAYILAIELLCTVQAFGFLNDGLEPCKVSKSVIKTLRKEIPFIDKDMQTSPFVEHLKEFILDNKLSKIAKNEIGSLE